MQINPIDPRDQQVRTAVATSRRTLGSRFPSRRTLGKNLPSRRTLGSRVPSRRTAA